VAEGTATETGVNPQRAAELIEAGGEPIDVRRADEWDAGRIAGARRIEINDLAGEAESIARDRPIVFYCRSGSRSALAAAAFKQAGWDAYNLDGGLEAWAAAGLELEPRGGEVAPSGPGT
jgi:rhodanese-related sulfurtransferase